ncbi:MAG: hypothetical protein NVSMB15_00510 [Steroidobacteraceae bacterium]
MPSAQALGLAEALASYCTKADPEQAGKYVEVVKQMVDGQSQKDLAEVRGSDEYLQAYQSVADFAAHADAQNSKQICLESVAAGQ